MTINFAFLRAHCSLVFTLLDSPRPDLGGFEEDENYFLAGKKLGVGQKKIFSFLESFFF